MRGTEESAFEGWAAARGPSLRRTAFLICGDWHLAEDLTQTALVKLYVAWPRLRTLEQLDAYARRVLVNAAIDESRRPWRRESLVDSLPEDRARLDPTSAVDSALDAMALLAKLHPRQRAAMVLRYWEDLSVEEAAHVLRCSPGTVKSQTHRAAATLRGVLAGVDKEDR